MFTILNYVGPAVITYMIFHKLADKPMEFSFITVLEMVVYTVLNTLVGAVLLKPLGLIETRYYNGALNEISFKRSGFIAMVLISVVMGLVVSYVRGHIKVSIELEADEQEEAVELVEQVQEEE